MYQKEIIYIGLYKDGSRIGNAGFLKVENREQESRLDLKLRNIPFNIKGRFPIRIHNGNDWKEINGVSVQEGGGSWEENVEDAAQKVQIQVMLPGGYFLEGRSRNASAVPPQEPTDAESDNTLDPAKEKTGQEASGSSPQSHPETELSGLQEEIHDNVWHPIPENIESETRNNTRQDSAKEMKNNMQRDAEIISLHSARERRAENGLRELQASSAREAVSGSSYVPEPPAAYSLKEDKWEQILDSYERIHPYGDERVYVKLEPKDFIILQSKYQHLVNNSFLLHGFYNYRYVILGKENDFYLGVPGVFYEREKMVALMFGFEAFECPGGVARAGEFGYYLRKVEL